MTPTTTTVRPRRGLREWLASKDAFPYLMLAPAILSFCVLTIFPILKGLQMSFFDYTLIFPTYPYIGLQNYVELGQDQIFWSTLNNTLLFTLIGGGLGTAIAVVLALILNRKFRGVDVARTVILIPWVAPTLVVGYIFVWIFNGVYSPINVILMELGIIRRPIGFLSDLSTLNWGPVTLPFISVALTRLWLSFSYKAIIFLAALQSIPEQLYEAATIDGASKWQQFRVITAPFLVPVVSIILTLTLIWHIGHFDINFFMTQGGPDNATNVMSVLVYLKAFGEFRLGYAAAMGVVMLFITGIIAFLYIQFIVRREENIM